MGKETKTNLTIKASEDDKSKVIIKDTKSNLTIKASEDDKSKVKVKKENLLTNEEIINQENVKKTENIKKTENGRKIKLKLNDNKELSTDNKELSTDNKELSIDKVGGATKTKKNKMSKKIENDLEEHEEILINGKRVRSFKVKLPNSENFEGRFTGLTPYQAANKALSKYFREGSNDPLSEITFSICESTRKSKKSTYTYTGRRLQLEVPVKYTIQDGREIVKNFKNSLKKVKKTEIIKN
jgi:hypothetical protein